MADKTPQEHPGAAAMKSLWMERASTDEAIARLRKSGDADGTKGVTIEAAVLTAQSNRELAAATIVAAETLDRRFEIVGA